MNKTLTFFQSSFIVFALFLGKNSNAQVASYNGLINNGPSDATKLAKAYFMPAFKGFGFGMNSGWFNSAKAKNLGRFDIRIQASAAFVPESDQSFNLGNLGLSSFIQPKNGSSSPTLLGPEREGTTLSLRNDNNAEVTTVTLPSSSGLKFAPSPQVQLTVGLIKNTDLSIRYTPQIGNESGDFGAVQVLGIGAKHEINKIIFGKAAKVIPIDIAVSFGYNQLKYDYKLPVDQQIDDRAVKSGDLNQKVNIKQSGYTFDAIVSKKLAMFTPFASIGYNTSKSELNVLGDYIVRTGTTTTHTFRDPVKIEQTDLSGLRTNLGFSLHIVFLRLYGAYSIGEYSAFTGGIGIGIGK